MRKITEKAIENFYNGIEFKSGNTQVVVETLKYTFGEVATTYLVLHGSKIAYTNDCETAIRTNGFDTTTTKERLRGVLSELDTTLYTKKGVMYLNYSCCDTQDILKNSNEWHIVATA